MEMNAWKCSVAVLLSLLILLPNLSEALECYACNNQDSNQDKCVKTTKQCVEEMDGCVTRIRWGLPPYWIPYGDRQHYIWKECMKRNDCEQEKKDTARFCKRDWFDDWSCTECCTGDLCNFYVTLAAGRWQHSLPLIAVCTTLVLWIRQHP